MVTLPFSTIACHPTKAIIVLTSGSQFYCVDSNNLSILAAPALSPIRGGFRIPADKFPVGAINAVAFYGDLIALVSDEKILQVWSSVNWELLSSRTTQKRVNAIEFTPCGQSVVVGDKFGDVYSFLLDRSDKSGSVLLGHVSIITDLMFWSKAGNHFLLTSDRDEKVRVSHFPHTFDIQSFCLGHKQFITQICKHPGSDGSIVSVGGESILYVWDIETGSCLQSLNIADALRDNGAPDECEVILSAVEGSEATKVVAVLIHDASFIILFDAAAQDLRLSQILKLENMALGIAFDVSGFLWVASTSGSILRYKKDGATYSSAEGLCDLAFIEVSQLPDFGLSLRQLRKLDEEKLEERRHGRGKKKGIEDYDEQLEREKKKKKRSES